MPLDIVFLTSFLGSIFRKIRKPLILLGLRLFYFS
nr:MAG TPA: hypothetical protein [Caudoviricetes sp.]